MERKQPTGFVAKCQCGAIVGAMDYRMCDSTRSVLAVIQRLPHLNPLSHRMTSRREAGETLGRWLHYGCTVEPRFAETWSVDVGSCLCCNNGSTEYRV